MAKITDKQFEQIQQKIAGRVCQFCKGVKLTIHDEMLSVQLNPYVEGGLALGSSNVAAIMATCTNCGQIVFLDAYVMGITK